MQLENEIVVKLSIFLIHYKITRFIHCLPIYLIVKGVPDHQLLTDDRYMVK